MVRHIFFWSSIIVYLTCFTQGIVADPSNLSQYILDMFHRVMALLMEVRSLHASKVVHNTSLI